MNWLQNLGYIFLVAVVTCLCFWQYLKTTNERETDILASSGLSRKEARAKMRARKKNLWLLGAVVLVWLVSVVAAFAGQSVFFALVLSVAACIAIWYNLNDTDTMQLAAMKFLIAPIGLAVCFYIGKMLNLPGIWTYIFGIAGAIGFVVITHYIHKAMVNDLDDEEEDEPPAETPVATNEPEPVTRTVNQTINRTPIRHRRTVSRNCDDESDNLDLRIIEELSKTEQGQRQLIEMLRRGR